MHIVMKMKIAGLIKNTRMSLVPTPWSMNH